MPAYNGAATIGRAIDSVLAQTDPGFELIVIDDGSRDATRERVDQFVQRDDRIRLLVLERNGGVARARNAGIDAARGRYLAFLDADDYWLTTKLARQREAFAAGASVVCSAYFREGASGRRLVTPPAQFDFAHLLRGNCIGNLTGAYDREVLGTFRQESIGHEDYLMWLEVLQRSGSAVAIQEPLAVYSDGGASLSSSLPRSARWTWRIYRRHLGLSWPASSRCFASYLLGAVRKRYG